MGGKTLKDRVFGLSTEVAALSERISNLIDINKKDQKEVIYKIDILCKKVNHQHTNHENRLQFLEDEHIKEKSKYAERARMFKWLSALLAASLSLVGILKALGII